MTGAVALLAGLSGLAALSFGRVVSGAQPVAVLVAGALSAHAGLALARRQRLGSVGFPLASAAGPFAVALIGLERSTAWHGLPTPATLGALAADLTEGVAGLRSTVVPVSADSSLVVVALVVVWLAALAADWVAFRLGAALGALLPSLGVLTLTSAVGSGAGSAPLSAAFLVAAGMFVIQRTPVAPSPRHWFVSRTAPGRVAPLLRAGIPVLAVMAVAGPLVGPRLPDARSEGVLDLGPGAGPVTRVTVSPLVGIRDRISQSPPVTLFTVRATVPAYWRLAALESFDGDIWSSHASFRRAGGSLPGESSPAPDARLDQEYRIASLAQFWLPAAYRPVAVRVGGDVLSEVRVNPASLTLITERETADGLVYAVTSELPRYTPADLATATGEVPEAVRDLLTLPVDFPPRIHDLATEVAGDAPGPYAKALALQSFLRDGFGYREDVPAGHSDTLLERFLFESRAGYCEQFASSFAVMARSVGLPARVAVGFLPGHFAGGIFEVTTRHAHAWPEVYLHPYGWVAFEPTPTRFEPSPTNHTGTFNPEVLPVPTPPAPPAAEEAPAPAPEAQPPNAPEPATPGPGERGSPAGLGAAVTGASLLLVGSGYALLALAARARRRVARRRVAAPRAAVGAAWTEALERLTEAGVPARPASTSGEVARAGRDAAGRAVGTRLDRLARLADAAAYARAEPQAADVGAAWREAEATVALLDAEEPATARLCRVFRPRSLLGTGSSARAGAVRRP